MNSPHGSDKIPAECGSLPVLLVAAVVNALGGITGADVPGSCQMLVILVLWEYMSQIVKLLLTTTLCISPVISVAVVDAWV